MKSVSDSVFEYSDEWASIRMEFRMGPDGTAGAMIHDVDGMPSPLPRLGPLPEGWEGCVPDGRG